MTIRTYTQGEPSGAYQEPSLSSVAMLWPVGRLERLLGDTVTTLTRDQIERLAVAVRSTAALGGIETAGGRLVLESPTSSDGR